MESSVTYRQGVKFFESKCQVIAVICNCTSDRPIGFIRQVIERFPYVDINKNRIQKPGTLELWGKKSHGQRYVLGLFAQHSRDDQGDQRLEWLKTCLKKITKQIDKISKKIYKLSRLNDFIIKYESFSVQRLWLFFFLLIRQMTS